MDTYILVAIGVFFAGIFGARFINESAFKLLNQEQKAGLIDVLAGIRKKTLIYVVGIIAIFLLLLFASNMDKSTLFLIYFGLLAILMIGTTISTRRILNENHFPKDYINQYLLSSCVRYFGIGVFLIVMFLNDKFTF
ncbi:MAG: hypothetical protein AAF487_10645 [Bacteroidota bacterium]